VGASAHQVSGMWCTATTPQHVTMVTTQDDIMTTNENTTTTAMWCTITRHDDVTIPTIITDLLNGTLQQSLKNRCWTAQSGTIAADPTITLQQSPKNRCWTAQSGTNASDPTITLTFIHILTILLVALRSSKLYPLCKAMIAGVGQRFLERLQDDREVGICPEIQNRAWKPP